MKNRSPWFTLLGFQVIIQKLHVHCLCTLLTYDYQICIVGAPQMDAPTDRFTLVWPTLQGHGSRCKNRKNLGHLRGTNCNCCTQKLVILHVQKNTYMCINSPDYWSVATIFAWQLIYWPLLYLLSVSQGSVCNNAVLGYVGSRNWNRCIQTYRHS